MTESLRERCIEAIVKAIRSQTMDDHDSLGWLIEEIAPRLARSSLDAVLNVLEESAEEWADYPAHADPIVVAHREIIARKLVGVLRGNGE